MPHALPIAFIGMPGGIEWVIIGIIALLLFGKRLPGVAKSLGQAMHEFRSGITTGMDDEEKAAAEKKAANKTPAKEIAEKTDDDAKPSADA